MTEIWLSALTIIVLILLLRLLKGDGKQARQEAVPENNLHSLMVEFEQENKELVRSIAQIKRMVDIELSGIKEELVLLREKTFDLEQQNKELVKQLTEIKQSAHMPNTIHSVHVPPPPSFLTDYYQDIPRLYMQGMSSHEIARKLGIGDGEVEMVLQMLKKQGFLPTK